LTCEGKEEGGRIEGGEKEEGGREGGREGRIRRRWKEEREEGGRKRWV
jgi:hypothetical protein